MEGRTVASAAVTEYSCCAPRAKMGSGGQLCRGRMCVFTHFLVIPPLLRCNVCGRVAAGEPYRG